MKNPSVPTTRQASLVEVSATDLETINGGAAPLMTATEYVAQIMSHVPPSTPEIGTCGTVPGPRI